MSRRKINLMRAVLHGLLAALAILSLGRLPEAVAEAPGPTPTRKLALLPGARELQDRLMVINPLALPQPGPRVVVLPERAPLAAAPAWAAPAWAAHLDAGSLLLAMRRALALAPSPAASPAPARPAAARRTEARPAAVPAPAPAAAWSYPRPRPIASPVDLELTTHHSLVVQSPVPLTRVSITDDAIAQAIVVSPNQVLVQGRAPGEVSLLLWDADANARAYTVRVGLDPGPLQSELERLYPHNRLRVSASGDALVVSGVMDNGASAKQALDVAAGFSKHIVNNLSVDAADDPGQVMLQVRFAEVDRSAVAQFGANLLSTGAGKTVGSLSTGQFGGPAGAIVPGSSTTQPPGGTTLAGTAGKFGLNDLLNVFLFRSDANLGATLQALQQQNLLQILAEPNLVAMDGKEASFLAGGEFPFPVVQGQGAVNNVTIQFKPFGVNLHFKPTILPDGTIDLQVAPEVSALDFSNALTVSGFLIPALSTRRASTELELADGQSFVIAGLMDNRLTKNLSKLPGLGDIPILGKFFQSWSTNKSRSELVVVVTAHLVHASNRAAKGPRMPLPFLLPERFDRAAGGHR
ncbi:MAG TPA: pilus assembly protein N-terminal domain-containing protein [Terriglobales bacterium]|nr:pilus assembly protein N-terminal domain-containing protein [Terriglobales bacterium]